MHGLHSSTFLIKLQVPKLALSKPITVCPVTYTGETLIWKKAEVICHLGVIFFLYD